jgi:hypothetical protein
MDAVIDRNVEVPEVIGTESKVARLIKCPRQRRRSGAS